LSVLHFAIPGDLETRTGGYAYDRRVIRELREIGWTVEHIRLPDGFPRPDAGAMAEAERMLAALPDGALLLVDGLAFGAMPRCAEREGHRLRVVALVHHPLALETGLDDADRRAFEASERQALAHARRVIVTSTTTAETLARDFGVSAERITVALPGTDPAPRSQGSTPPLILSIGTLTRRKGHDVLINALAEIRDLDWQCRIVGAADRDPAHARKLDRLIADLDLSARVTLAGEVEDPGAELARSDVFALASRYEGYGMVFAEALRQGVPVVGCRVGAVPDVVPPEAGILVEPDDHRALAEALRGLLANPARRRALADGAFAAGCRLPDWRSTAATISAALKDAAR
jgi:glycosyltransferase involved in cell wall biosynthesis